VLIGSGARCVNRSELQIMTEERLKDAKALLDGGRWEFAYYVAGYAVECGLKSCILARMIYTGWLLWIKKYW
jgi:HEPN domain-containing protein